MDDTADSGPSRRAILGGMVAGSVAMAFPLTLLEQQAASAAAGPVSGTDAAILANSLVGYTRAMLTPVVVDSPWISYGIGNAWCAWFGSWITRATNVGYQTFASGFYGAGTAVTTPQAGDIVYYPGVGHAGLVVDYLDGHAAVVEGNAGDDAGIVKFRAHPFTTCQFSRPTYPLPNGSSSSNGVDSDMTDLIYYANSSTSYTTNGIKTPAVTVTPNSMWYQERPGAPLYRITDNYNGATNYQGNLEYIAFNGARFLNAAATRQPATTTDIGKLIELRGESLQPTASLAPLRT